MLTFSSSFPIAQDVKSIYKADVSPDLQKLISHCESGEKMSEALIYSLFSYNNPDIPTLNSALTLLHTLPIETKANLLLFEGACDEYVELVLLSAQKLIKDTPDMKQNDVLFHSLRRSNPYSHLSYNVKEQWIITLHLMLEKLPIETKARLPINAKSCEYYIWAIIASMKTVLQNGTSSDKSYVLTRARKLSKNERLPGAVRIELSLLSKNYRSKL